MPPRVYAPCPWTLPAVQAVGLELYRRDHAFPAMLMHGDAGVLLDLILEHHADPLLQYLPLARTLFWPYAPTLRATHWLVCGWLQSGHVVEGPTQHRMLCHIQGTQDFRSILSGQYHLRTEGLTAIERTLTDILCGWNHGQHSADVICTWQVYTLIDRLTPS